MEIQFKIKNDMLVLEKQRKAFSGNVNYYKCRFEILTNRELVWICVFKKGDKVYQQVIEDGVCKIPQEVLLNEGEIAIGCYAVSDAENFQRISTNWIPVTISKGAYSEGTAPKIPEKDVWEILMLKNIPHIGENGNWYIFNTEKMEYVDSGRSSIGEKGEKGDRGETGLPGTTNAANALKGRMIGQSANILDMSPVEHILDVKVKSKNLVKMAVYNDVETGVQNGAINATLAAPLKKGRIYTASWQTENTGAEKLWFTLVTNFRTVISKSSSFACDGERKFVTFQMTEDVEKASGVALQTSPTNVVDSGLCSNFMVEEGEVVTEYTPYIEDVSDVLVEVNDENGRLDEVYPSQDGTLENVVSSYPSMSLLATNPNTVVDVTYNRDINKAFAELEEKMTNAIISLGGNV